MFLTVDEVLVGKRHRS